MSKVPCDDGCMEKKKAKKRVILEPRLEEIAGHLGIFDRLMLADDMERWVRQLRVSAKAMASKPWIRKHLPRLASKLRKLN